MKITFSRHALKMLAERQIEVDWATRTIRAPEAVEPEPLWPDAVRAFRSVPEHGGRVPRVVYARNGEDCRVITVFLDRSRRK